MEEQTAFQTGTWHNLTEWTGEFNNPELRKRLYCTTYNSYTTKKEHQMEYYNKIYTYTINETQLT